MEYTIENVCFFDTETTGLPEKGMQWDKDFAYFPRIVSFGWIYKGVEHYHIIKPEGYVIPQAATEIHGISHDEAMKVGENFEDIAIMFLRDALEADFLCIHNAGFDTSILKAQILAQLPEGFMEEYEVEKALYKGKRLDTMYKTIKFVGALYPNGRPGKFPKLQELHEKIFPGQPFDFHHALGDCQVMAKCLPVLLELGVMELEIRQYDDAGNPIKKPKISDNTTVENYQAPAENSVPKTAIKKRTGIVQKSVIDFQDPNPVTDPLAFPDQPKANKSLDDTEF